MKKVYLCFDWILAVFALMVGLSGCASDGVTRAMNGPPPRGASILPGDSPWFSFGPYQKPENFVNVERAQANLDARNADFVWAELVASNYAHPRFNILGSYFPFDARWRLKDGREFILENIDVRTIANDFLQKSPIQLPWQRERRPRHSLGDYDPLLTYQVKDDTVLLIWVISTNKTPVDQRRAPSGAVTKWEIAKEEIFMAAIRGNPTVGIDFTTPNQKRK
jgi:hypothetical protein